MKEEKLRSKYGNVIRRKYFTVFIFIFQVLYFKFDPLSRVDFNLMNLCLKKSVHGKFVYYIIFSSYTNLLVKMMIDLKLSLTIRYGDLKIILW